MKIRMSRRIIAMALAFVMVVGLLPSVAFARTAGKDGSAAMNEDYEAKKTLMPLGPSFSTYTLLEWTAESDPDAAYSRASIPLKERVGGFVVNPLANPEAKLMLCSLANSDHDHTSAQGTESFLSYSFNYWQYVDSFVYWSGSQEGLVVVPTGEFTDAAHTNGVPVVATLGFPWGSGSGYVEEVNAFCQKAADGTFPVADKLIEVMDYYGFDGYFFNQESYGCSAETASRLNEMIHYMHAKRPDMLISWYDSMVQSGSVSYGDGVNESNKFWMADDANGVRGVDEFFMNYNWTASKIATTISSMKSINRSQFDAFAGLDVQQNCMNTWFSDHLLVDEDGIAKLSLALYCPNSTLGLSADGAQFHEVERTFYTNAVEDPRDTSVDVADSSVSAWAGMSRLFADKTPITTAPFVTDFNSGHGTGYYVDGVLSRDAEWSYQSNQDVMPTWTWIIDSTGTKLSGDYDFTDAYNGGNSIKFYGDLNAANDILLYSTNIAVESKLTLSLTAKGGLENASLVAYLDDGTAAEYADSEQVVTALATGEGWVETKVDLSAYAGKTLKAIGLKIEGDVADYQINLGRITVLEKTRAALNGPASVKLDEIMYTDAYTAEARVQWDKVTGAASYEIYKVNADGSKTLIMETPSTAFYIPSLKRAADETDVTIEIVPINRNGVRGKGTKYTIDWLYGNDDSDEVVVQTFENVCLNAEVTDVSFENSGEPASKALDGTSANNSKWCATNMGSGYMCIDIGREVTVKRWRVEHAEYGGESNDMNTVDFALEYLDKNSNNWVEVKRIQDNHDAVTDVLLDTPVTAQEWRLYVYDDGSSPWGGIRIYEWQMFETDQFPQTDVVPMHFASAVNNVGADDTFSLKYVPEDVTVKVYTADGTELGSGVSNGTDDVVITGLDFGTADAGRVYYTTTSNAAAESVKLSAPFEAETAEKSEPATDVEFVKFSHPGSTTSYNGDDVYTTLTVNGLNEGDVVYVYENGADADYTKASLPVENGATSVSIDRVMVRRAGTALTLRVKRVGCLLSDAYTVQSPVFEMPTAQLKVFARNENGESLTGVRFELRDGEGNVIAQFSTTSDSGATATVALGSYTLYCTEVPEGYAIPAAKAVSLTTEGALTELEVILSEAGEEPEPTDPTDPEPTDPVINPADDSRDIPVENLTATAGDFETAGGASEGPPELVLDGDPSTIWHTDWTGTSRDNHWIQLELSGDYNVDGLRYQPRQSGGANGLITEYDIQVSDDGVTFRSVATGNWTADPAWKLVQFPAEHVKYVRLVSLDATSEIEYVFASAAEIRLTGEVYVPEPEVDPTVNQALNAEIIAYNGNALDNEKSGPAKLFNGAWSNEATDKWCEDGNNLWVAFDIGTALTYGELKLYHAGANNEWMPDNGSTNTAAYEFYVLNTDKISVEELLSKSFDERTTLLSDSSYWTLAASRTENTEDITTDELDVAGRIFKLNISVTDTANWAPCVRVYELEMYATGGTAPQPPVPEEADKTALNELIAECELIEKGNYTDESWNAFQTALQNARTVSADPDATQAAVNAAREALVQAWEDLEENSGEVVEGVQKIFHLDSGRTYYSKDWTIALLNELAAAGYTHLQLAFGNDGFRFVLDDMTIEANGKTYASDDVKAAIELGNEEYNKSHTDNSGDSFCAGHSFEKNALTEAEMDEIIVHAENVGIEIVPHLNMPGHMDALLDAMVELGISGAHFTGYTTSDRSLDLENEEAVAFLQALLDKYAEYFSANGSKYFHIGADEYGNDAYSGNMGFPSMGSALYQKFAEFVNANAAIVEDYGMTARAWNDGIYYGSYTAEFDPDIEITYWSSGWWGYNLAKTSKFIEKGNGLINTHGDYYFILGVNDKFTPGNTTEHDPNLYTEAASYDITYFMDGSTVTDPVGGMFCVWGDHPFGETEQEVAANVRLVLRAMALRMDGKSLDGMDTSVVEGGFNEDGTINGEVVEPTVYTITVEEPVNGTVTADKAEAVEGETVTVTATADEGYVLVAIYVNGIAIEGSTFEMPARDVTITAEFTALGDSDEALAAAEAAQAAADAAAESAGKAAAAAAKNEAAQEAADAAAEAAEAAQAAADEAAAAAAVNDVEAAKHAQLIAELYAEIAEMNARIAEYLADEDKTAEEAEEYRKAQEAAALAAAKAYALIVLEDAAEDSEAQGEKLDAIVAEAIEAINAAETIEAVEEALANALAAIEALDALPFVDVPKDSFYYDAVEWAVEEGITTGTTETTFSPDKTVSRAEAVTFLWRAAGEPEPTTGNNPFSDVTEADFFYKAVLWAVEEGITNGLTETTFGPYATANRAQIVTFLWRAMEKPAVAGEEPFTDVNQGDFFYEAVLWAVDRGVTNGLADDFFGAETGCNRAQMVTFLYRAYK